MLKIVPEEAPEALMNTDPALSSMEYPGAAVVNAMGWILVEGITRLIVFNSLGEMRNHRQLAEPKLPLMDTW